MNNEPNADYALITLPDGTLLWAFEVEVESRPGGKPYMPENVPVVCAVDWRHGHEDHDPKTVRLFAVVQNDGSGGAA